MATETSFRSNLRKGENTSAGGTRDRRRVFEDGGGGGGGGSVATSRFSRDRTERTDSPSRTTTSRLKKVSVDDDEENLEGYSTSNRTVKKYGGTSSIANKMNKMSINDDDDADNDSDDKQEEAPKKQIKKSAGKTGNKRKEKRHLREKRRSTGVVIMPGQPVSAADEEERLVQENTAKNLADGNAASDVTDAKMDADSQQNEQYIEELKDELAKAHRELDILRKENLRLKDENKALLRVVGSLTGSR